MLCYSYVYLPVVTRVNCSRGSRGNRGGGYNTVDKTKIKEKKVKRKKKRREKRNKECNNVTEWECLFILSPPEIAFPCPPLASLSTPPRVIWIPVFIK